MPKETLTNENDLNGSAFLKSKDDSKDKCRLVYSDYADGLYTETYSYNSKGLVKEVKLGSLGSFYFYATMQYDRKDRIVTGSASFDGINYYEMSFEYQNDRIIREITYEPGTTNIIEVVTNTYNHKGQMVRREDPVYDFYATFEYDREGNNTISDLRYLSNNYLILRVVNHYKKHIKSPYTARPGITQSWWYSNDVTSPLVPTERDEYWGDGEGGEFLAFDEDPAKTIINPTAQNLTANRLTFDNISGNEIYQYWEYENCGRKNESDLAARKSMPDIGQRAMDIAKLRMPLLRGPQLKKQLEERKLIVQRLKK